MRTVTAAQEAAIASRSMAQHLRVEVKDSGGTWRDMSSYPGFDSVLSASWRENIDDPHATADVVLLRELDALSLAPLMETSPANLAFAYPGSYAALLDVTRELRISVATMPSDAPSPAAGDWMVVFHGRIDQLDAAAGDTVRLTCRDLGGQLADAWIETERVYSYGTVSTLPVSMRVWTPGMTLVLNEYILPSETKRNGRFYKVTTAGTGGSSEPAWPTSSTVADGTATLTHQGTVTTTGHIVETVMRNILDDNSFSAVTLSVPSASTWAIKQYKQDRTSVLEALRNLALQIGWDVRYKWNTGASEHRLTFFQPDRAKATTDRTFGSDDYEDVTRLALDVAGIRNVVLVNYPDAADLDAAGNPKRKTVTSTDGTSVSRFGRRFMEMSEPDAGQIDTSTEAQAYADAARKDLAWPKAEQSVSLCYGFPWAEPGDRYAFSANGRHYSSTQTLAVVGVEHRAENGGMRTELLCRGQPAGAYDVWQERSANNQRDDVVDREVFTSQSGITVSTQPVVGGVRISVTSAPLRGTEEPSFEYHVGTTSTFTVNSSSLKAVSKARTVELTDLVPGATYYARVVPVYFNGGVVRGQPSDGVSFVPSRASTAHLTATYDWGSHPLNGNFESQFDAASPPDHWTVAQGTWGSTFTRPTTGAARGACYLKGDSSTYYDEIRSAIFPVKPGNYYLFSWWEKYFSGVAGWAVRVRQLNEDLSLGATTTAPDIPTSSTSWTQKSGVVRISAPYVFAQLAFFRTPNNAGSAVAGVDLVRFDDMQPTQQDWQAPSLQNSYTDSGGGNATAGYMRSLDGRIHLRGLIGGGTATDGTTMLTLPVDYRPAASLHFTNYCENGSGTRAPYLMVINSDGTVKLYAMGTFYNTYVALTASFDIR